MSYHVISWHVLRCCKFILLTHFAINERTKSVLNICDVC